MSGTIAPATPTPPSSPTIARSEPTRYRVRDGDTLRSIAVRFYGDERFWQKIYRANRASIDQENISVGEVLIIPPP